MTTTRLDDFRAYREKMNERVMALEHLGIKRFFNLDTAAYRDPHLRHAVETIDLLRALHPLANDQPNA